MVFNQLSDKAKLRRYRTNEAIALAMQGRWEEAVAVNRSIIDLFYDDADAYNRLGKAYTQLGNYAEAKEAYGKALEIDPDNAIARRNFERLNHLKDSEAEAKATKRVSSHLFIGETGKSDVADLIELAPQEVLAKISAGDPVLLNPDGQRLLALTENGDYIGEVEPRIGLRLVKLMEGGNRYSSAIASISENVGRVMIREIYQDPSQAGKPSFPAKNNDEFRSYVKDSMLKYELEDEEETYDEENTDEWDIANDPIRKQHSNFKDAMDFSDDSVELADTAEPDFEE